MADLNAEEMSGIARELDLDGPVSSQLPRFVRTAEAAAGWPFVPTVGLSGPELRFRLLAAVAEIGRARMAALLEPGAPPPPPAPFVWVRGMRARFNDPSAPGAPENGMVGTVLAVTGNGTMVSWKPDGGRPLSVYPQMLTVVGEEG